MAGATSEISLSTQDLREVAGYAAACAQEVLAVIEGPSEFSRAPVPRPVDPPLPAYTHATPKRA
jgi:hypothetical protein